MQRVIVTVQLRGEEATRDLEVPAEVPAGRLALLIARALRLMGEPASQPPDYQIEVYPEGRRLAADESLADAGVWDGAWLVLALANAPPEPGPPVEQPASPVTKGPLAGWRSLEIEVPAGAGDEAATGEAGASSGYGWKRLDE